MKPCVDCRSWAVNPHSHGRDNTRLDLCDVCYWRAKAEEWRRDAERYRWLRDNPEHGSAPYFEDGKWHAPHLISNAGGSGAGVGLRTYETLGDAIDAARKEGV